MKELLSWFAAASNICIPLGRVADSSEYSKRHAKAYRNNENEPNFAATPIGIENYRYILPYAYYRARLEDCCQGIYIWGITSQPIHHHMKYHDSVVTPPEGEVSSSPHCGQLFSCFIRGKENERDSNCSMELMMISETSTMGVPSERIYLQ